jgi:aminopeptidase
VEAGMSEHGQRVAALAELAVGFGANVQPGQVVGVNFQPGQEPLVRAIAEAAYARGARFVDPWVFDPYVKRARMRHAEKDSLGYVPPWYGDRVLGLGETRAAIVALTGPSAPTIMDGIDPERLGLDMLPRIRESGEVTNQRLCNWVVIACPTPGWASLVHPELDPEHGLARLWDQVAHVTRLDEPDPVAAWRERFDRLTAVGTALNAQRFDAVRFEGPGTDLTVGLLAGSRWVNTRMQTVDGIEHVANLPSEELFTTPDPARVDGVVAATKPLTVSGQLITGLRVRFEAGRAVEIDADTGAGTLRALAARDEGAARLGEVALVDGESRIGQAGITFFETLLDENAASHIALGRAYDICVEGAEDLARTNRSEIHVDFMIGSDAVTVSGVPRKGGADVPVLREGCWQL